METDLIAVVIPIIVGLYVTYEYVYGTAAEVRQMRGELKAALAQLKAMAGAKSEDKPCQHSGPANG